MIDDECDCETVVYSSKLTSPMSYLLLRLNGIPGQSGLASHTYSIHHDHPWFIHFKNHSTLLFPSTNSCDESTNF